MNIAIIDADLIGRSRHSTPNLACMKISGYYKALGHDVTLKLDYKGLSKFDKVFISKVFTDTPIDESVLLLSNVEYGGTGFYYDKAPNLPDEIEHHMPDYTLYSKWVEDRVAAGDKPNRYHDYVRSSIGFTSRGCFRKCDFCVNKKYDRAFKHSPVSEFLDPSRPVISLWDDNFLACAEWRSILEDLLATNKYIQFRQGLDIRLITDEKAQMFSKIKKIRDYTFAFDHIEDREIIEEKLAIWKKYVITSTKLYVLCGYDRQDKWDADFWNKDIIDTFERIKILMKYGCMPYLMRFNRYEESPHRGIYITLARWCNQPSMFKNKSFREFCCDTKGVGESATRYFKEFEKNHPEIAKEYFDLRYRELNQYSRM